jgi:hypothetical protein
MISLVSVFTIVVLFSWSGKGGLFFTFLRCGCLGYGYDIYCVAELDTKINF